MGCGASTGIGAKYAGHAETTKPRDAAEGKTLRPESEPLQLQQEPEPQQLATPAFERRAGWVDVRRPPLDKKLAPEWCARWLVIHGSRVQVFKQDPKQQRAAARGFFQKEVAPAEPVQTLSLCDHELGKLTRNEAPEGCANGFWLKLKGDEDKSREAAIDDAFTAAAAVPKSAKKPSKGELRPKNRAKAPRPKKGSKAHSKPSANGNKKSGKKPKARPQRKPNLKPATSGLSSGSTVSPTLSLIVDPGTASEFLWWCRALYEAGTKVPVDIQTKIEDMYVTERYEQTLAKRRVWRQQLVRISRYLPRCVVQRHTDEEDIAPIDEPKMEVFDAAVAQIHVSGVTKLVEKLSAQQQMGHDQLQFVHHQLFSTVLQTIEDHGGDVVTMCGDAIEVMWGNSRGWGRQDPGKLKRNTLRACQCLAQLRSQSGSDTSSTKNPVWQGAKCKVRCAVSAGRVCGVWAGGYLDRRHFTLKGAPILELRRAAFLAGGGDIVLTPEANRLCGEDSIVTSPIDCNVEHEMRATTYNLEKYVALEQIMLTRDGEMPTAIECLEPLHTLTSNPKIVGNIEKLKSKEADLFSDLAKLQLEEAPEISVANMPFLSQFDAVMKAILKLRSLLKEHFLDELLVFLKSQGQADFDLIRRYEKARRFMLEVLTDEMMDEFKSAHWNEWDRWKDELHDAKERERAQTVEPLALALDDDDATVVEEVAVEIEISKREIYDHGTKELLLDSTLKAIRQAREDTQQQDHAHEVWQHPVMDVMLEYIPDSVMPLVEGHQSFKVVEASIVCVQLPEQNFEKHDDDEEEFNRTTMTEIQTVVLCLQQLADKFGAHLREIVTAEQATIFVLILQQDAVQYHHKVGLVTALAISDCFTQMNFKPKVTVTSGTVFDQLVGDGEYTRCHHACMGVAVDAAVGLLRSASILPAEMCGVVCDEVTRNGALVSQAAISPNPSAAVWTMNLVFDALGRITLLGRRFRIFVPRRYDQWASSYSLRHRSSPFPPQFSLDVIGRAKEVRQVRSWLTGAGERRVLVNADPGYGKTALATVVYDDLHHNGYVCFAGKSLRSKTSTPFHAFWEILSAILIYAVQPTETPRLKSQYAQQLEDSLSPTRTEQLPLDASATPNLQQAAKMPKECTVLPWWISGDECGDSAVLLCEVEKRLPEALRSRLPLAKLLLPYHNLPESQITQDLDGKTRADATHLFVIDLIKWVLEIGERRVCIMIDDMQWLDHASANLIRIIMDKVPDVAWYFNCDRRDMASSKLCTLLSKNTNTFSLQLGVLDAEYTMLLAERQCLEMGATFVEPESLDFFRKFPGIPLHTIHFTRSLFETEDIIVYGGYAKAGPRLTEPEHEPIPTDVGRIIRDRLKLLPEELHYLVCLPSSLDDEVPFTAAQAVLMSKTYFDNFDLETPFVTILEQVDSLCRLGFLARLEPCEQALIFPHKLVRDVAYGELSSEQQIRLHQDRAQSLAAQHKHAQVSPRSRLLKLFDEICERPDEAFCTSLDEKFVKEQSFHAGQCDTGHCAWISGASKRTNFLTGCRIFVEGHGFGTVSKISSANSTAHVAFDAMAGRDAVEETVMLDFEGNGIHSNFYYFAADAVSTAADTAIQKAQTAYSDFVGPSPFFQLVADEQLRFLHDLERQARESILQDCVENLYSALMQMARAGALKNAAELVMSMLGSLTDTIKLFESLPDRDTPERREQELDMIAIFHRNWLTEDVSELFHGVRPAHIARMRVLANTLGESTHVYPIAVAEWMMEYYAPKRCLHTCIRLAREFLTMAGDETDQPNDALLLEAYRMLWMVHADKGEWTEVIRLCTKVVHLDADVKALYSVAEYHESTFRYAGTDPGVSAWSLLAIAYLKKGEIANATGCMKEMLALAKALAHPLSIAVAFSTQLMLQFELKLWNDIDSSRAEVEHFQVMYDFPMLSMAIQCAAAEMKPSIAGAMYDEIMQRTKTELQCGSWATNQNFIGPILRSCQLVGEYGKGLAIATEIWMQSEIAVGRFQGETWCAWVPDVYLYLGQFKLIEAEQEQHEEMPPEQRASWREEVWAEGLRYLAQAVVVSRFTDAMFTEFRALMQLYQALETTKITGALKPRQWMSNLDPTILNSALTAEKLEILYGQLDGDSLAERITDFKVVNTLLQRLKSEQETAKLRSGRRAMLKMATHQALDEKRKLEEADEKRKSRAKAMWKQGKASAATEATERERQALQQQHEYRAGVAATLHDKLKQATMELEMAESATLVAGWVYREKNSKFGDFVAAYATIGAGTLTWLKAADPEKVTGTADLRGCTVQTVAKRRRKHPTAFEIVVQPLEALDPAAANEPEKFVIVPKDPAETDSWMHAIERNSLYKLEVVPLQEAARTATEAYAVAKKAAAQARKALKEHREESFAKAAFRNFRLVQDLTAKPKPEPVPEPEPEVKEAAPLLRRQVTVHGAASLGDVEIDGNRNPYGLVYWNGVEIGRTGVVKNTMNPTWGSVFVFSVSPDEGGQLKVEAYNFHQGAAHEFLGQVELGLNNLHANSPENAGPPVPFALPTHEYPLKPSSRHPGQIVHGSITLTVGEEDEEEPEDIIIGSLLVNIISARGLPKMDSFSHTDAYAQLEVEYTVSTTKVVRDTESPVWNEEFRFDIRHHDSAAVVRLFDHDPVDADDPIGAVTVNLAQLRPGRSEGWFPIAEVAGGPKGDLGELNIAFGRESYDSPAELAESQGNAHAQNIVGQLSVVVVEATSVHGGSIDKSDVYVSAEIAYQTRRTTTVVDAGSHAKWRGGKGERLEFNDIILQQSPKIKLQVLDEDVGSADDLLGEATVDLSAMQATEWMETVVALSINDRATNCGQLKLVLEWRPTTVPTAS